MNVVVMGAQWGDEGKGKIVDYLAQDAKYVVRFAGGANAGHTIVVDGKKYALHQVPSGILYQDKSVFLGSGMVIDKPCASCRGTGVTEKSKKISLAIPQGVDNGKRITIPKQGDVGENGGPAGDLVVILHVEQHPYFERDGQDLYCAVPISFSQAVLGSSITITSLDGKKIAIPIKEGTSNGAMLRIKGEGVPFTASSRRGDLYVKILVQIPSKINSKQKELLKEYMTIEQPVENPDLVKLSSLG